MSLKLTKIQTEKIRDSDRELIQNWLRQKAAHQRREKRRLVKQFLAFVQKPLSQVTVADVRSFVNFLLTRRTNPHQVLKTLASVKSLLLFGSSIGVLTVNIAEEQWPRLQVKKTGKQKRRLIIVTGSIFFGLCLIALPALTSKLIAIKNQNIFLEPTISLELNSEQKANLVNPQVRAFLDTIAWAEGTLGTDGYRMQFTGVKFSSLADHPRKVICASSYGQKRCSNAAGRYQFLDHTWDEVAKKLNIIDFYPISQDLVAIELIKIEGGLEDIKAGRFETAIKKVANRWASLPGNSYGQPKKSMSELRKFYQKQLDRYQTYPQRQQQV